MMIMAKRMKIEKWRFWEMNEEVNKSRNGDSDDDVFN